MNLCYSNNLDSSLFYVTDLNDFSSQQLLKGKGFYKIIWAADDDIPMVVDGCHIMLEKRHILFCTPMYLIQMDNYQEGIISIIFNREFYCIRDNDREVSCQGILFYGSSEPAMVTLNKKEEEDFHSLYRVLLEEFETRDHIQGEMLRVLLKRMLIKSTRLVRDKIPQPLLANEKLDLIRRFNVLVEEHYKKKHQVADYADMLNKSPKTISNLFRKYSDKTALTFINERILVEARRLLLFSDKTSEEIAYELGYREPGHFSKFFKKQMGSSPIEFRRRVYELAT